MATHTSFTQRQAEILAWLQTVSPTNWRQEIDSQLKQATSPDVVQGLIEMVREQRQFLDQIKGELPPEHMLSGFFFKSPGWHGAQQHTMATYDTESGGLEYLKLAGSDTEVAVREAYKHLDEMIGMGNELYALLSSSHRSTQLFPGKEEQAPYQQLLMLPDVVSKEQRVSIADVLAKGEGTINLKPLNKTNAAFIVAKLDVAMSANRKSIPKAHKELIEIEYADGTFTWWGTIGNSTCDMAKRLAGGSNANILQELDDWARLILG